RQYYPTAPTRASTTGRAVLTGAVVHVPDVQADHDYSPPAQEALRNRSSVSVPIMRDGVPIGAIGVGRRDVRPFLDHQIALLKTFADQAVIAIENVRLSTELQTRNREVTTALDQQTATADILRVISSSPTDVQPVFDTIVRSAVQLCGAIDGVVV